jgi:type II secretory pathway pseudopilin PulG
VEFNKKREDKRGKNWEKGFSLVESLLSLSLLLLLFLSSLQFFGFARNSFFKLKETETAREGALLALEKMKIDILQGGLGLLKALNLGLLRGIEEKNKTLIILSKEEDFQLLDNVAPGQTQIFLDNAKEMKKGREICIFDSKKGEIKGISSLTGKSITLDSPLSYSFLKEESRILLLRKISLFLDEKNQIIRRKVNNSSSQPLLEEVISFDFSYQEASNIINLCLILKSEKEKKYEISVFPKNMALAFIR